MDIPKKSTVRTFRKMKNDGVKIVMATAYDAVTAHIAEEAGLDLILVGDSLGMNTLGYPDTIPVTMDDMIHHCQCVRRGAPNAFVVGDMPFLSYNLSTEQAIRNAARFLQEANCDAVKLETDREVIPVVKALTDAGIPVMAHIGLLPQSLKTAGGYRVAGRQTEQADALLADALALQEAGSFSLVMECMPAELGKRVTAALEIPTIGIGAGAWCDGQVQVIGDLLGYSETFLPKHAKRYMHFMDSARKALEQYRDEVKNGTFPTQENFF